MRVAFHRPARFEVPEVPERRVMVSAPPQVPSNGGGSVWLTLLLPLLSSVAMAGYMITYGRPLLIVLGIGFVVVSVGVTFGIRWQMRRSATQDKHRQRDRYLEYLWDFKKEARDAATVHHWTGIVRFPSPVRLWAITRGRRRVWERRPADEDFLRVRVGLGRGRHVWDIQLGARTDPTVEYDPKMMVAATDVVDAVAEMDSQPAWVDLAKAGVVSVLGQPDQVRAVARALVCQVGVLHAPDDLVLAVRTAGIADWEWVKWLPHTYEPGESGPAGVVPLAAEQWSGLEDFLQRELERARAERTARNTRLTLDRSVGLSRRLLLVIDGFDPHAGWARSGLVTELLAAAGPELGITIMCLVQEERTEPSRVDVRVRVEEDHTMVVETKNPDLAGVVNSGLADTLQPVLCERIARALTPLRLSDEQQKALARTVPLSELFGIGEVATLDPRGLWHSPVAEDVLRVPIGADGDEIPVVLDLKESAQGGMGPHGLIVGATGSGKSELLRTLITGLTINHPPELLNFVLVDFKGGATFAGFTELPHVAGLITNLADDLAMVDRVRLALHGEQQRRQKLLRDAGNVDSIRDYQARREAGQTGQDGLPLPPMPYLLVVVDEFGELLSSRPAFIDLFVQIGRVGRSLGVHLLLATQRLEEGKLRGLDSHLSYRLCLRTFSAAESKAVIGTADAYELPPIPGSAYLKVNESIYQRFRVAHVSSPYRDPNAVAPQRPAVVPPLVLFGLRTGPVVTEESDSEDTGSPTGTATAPDLAAVAGPTLMQVVVRRLCQFGQSGHQVWLPPLPPAIPLDALLGPAAEQPGRGVQVMWPYQGRLMVPVGVIDLPEQQQQRPLVVDFAGSQGQFAIVGAPQSGKSTLLRTVLLSAMLTHTPDETQFYCVDYGGGTLATFESAPHVGAVTTRLDTHRTLRLVGDVLRLIGERERLFRDLGISSVGDFRRLRSSGELSDEVRSADVFLIVDNWGALRAELEDLDPMVHEIATRGLGVGVHLVLTANRWADIRMNLRDSIGVRLELRLNEPAESEVGRQLARTLTGGLPGRGVAPPGVLYQAMLPRLDGVDSAESLSTAQQDALDTIAAAWLGQPAPPVRMLPDLVTRTELAEGPGAHLEPSAVPIGLGELDLLPVYLDLEGDERHFLVFGDTGSGKSEFLRAWMRSLAGQRTAGEVRFMIVDYRRGLEDAVAAPFVGAYAGDNRATEAYIGQLAEKLAERMPPPGMPGAELRRRSWWTGPEFYVVVDDYDVVAGGHRQTPLAPLVEYLAHARDIGLHLVIARRVAGASRVLMSDPVLTRMTEVGASGLVLSGDPREGVVLGDQRAGMRPPGRGALVRRGAPVTVVQVACELDAEVPAEYARS